MGEMNNPTGLAIHKLGPEAAWRLGFNVFPVGLDKKPRSAWKSYQVRRIHEEEINQWMNMTPPAWAVVTGRISNVIVLDFDGAKGLHTMRQLKLDPHVRTGSGGYHVYFKHPGWNVPTL